MLQKIPLSNLVLIQFFKTFEKIKTLIPITDSNIGFLKLMLTTSNAKKGRLQQHSNTSGFL